MKQIFYAHANSKNHGCEAIIRATKKIIGKDNDVLLSFKPYEDFEYRLNDIIDIKNHRSSKKNIKWIIGQLLSKSIGYSKLLFDYTYKDNFKNPNNIYISIGGDNYCYKPYDWLFYINKKAKQNGGKTVLWGCSIEPKYIDSKMKEDLLRYDLITARESITYNALLKSGIDKNTHLYPDPAFVLDTINLKLPKNFILGKTIGINVSPLIMKYEKQKNSTMSNYLALVKHIIDTTDFQIALIPHVVQKNNDDRVPLMKIYDKFKHTGRLVMIKDCNCMELKGYISRCNMFIGARTHATIAAYSSCVPTLVVGYSVKAKGIAKDIFGTYKNYVIPVQILKNKNDLIQSFEWLNSHCYRIKKHLENFMPNYCLKAFEAKKEIQKLAKGEI